MPGCGRQEPLRAAIGPICAGLAVLAACSSPTRAGGTATLPTAAPSSTTTTTSDPWAVPATITPAYLDRVLAELDHIDGNAFRDARAHNAVTPTFTQLEQSIRAGPQGVQFEETAIRKEVQIRWIDIRTIPGDRRMMVESIMAAPARCVLASVSIDLRALTVGPPQSYPQWYVALVPSDIGGINPTHWSFADDGFEPTGGAPSPSHACAVD